jgi:hypothetical protein
VLAKLHVVATFVWGMLAAGAGAGFLARDALGLRQPFVALAWTTGAALALLPLARGRGRRGRQAKGERGQATVEFALLVLLAALVLGALAGFAARFDGHSFAGFLAFRIVCSIEGDCHDGDSALARAYGKSDAALVRDLAPNLVFERGERQLPVDWRRCRRPECAEGPDERDLDVHRSDAGERATAFTRLLRRGGRTYLQYWFYYPDSNTAWAGSDKLWDRLWLSVRTHPIPWQAPEYPGYHRDDWEAYAVRLDPDGRAWVRSSSHGHWQGCGEGRCKNRWTPRTGWTRVSRGSHGGHIPLRREPSGGGPLHALPRRLPLPSAAPPRVRIVPLLPGHDLHERTTTSEGLRLIPLETHDLRRYRPNNDVEPPWQKDVYGDPESDES